MPCAPRYSVRYRRSSHVGCDPPLCFRNSWTSRCRRGGSAPGCTSLPRRRWPFVPATASALRARCNRFHVASRRSRCSSGKPQCQIARVASCWPESGGRRACSWHGNLWPWGCDPRHWSTASRNSGRSLPHSTLVPLACTSSQPRKGHLCSSSPGLVPCAPDSRFHIRSTSCGCSNDRRSCQGTPNRRGTRHHNVHTCRWPTRGAQSHRCRHRSSWRSPNGPRSW